MLLEATGAAQQLFRSEMLSSSVQSANTNLPPSPQLYGSTSAVSCQPPPQRRIHHQAATGFIA